MLIEGYHSEFLVAINFISVLHVVASFCNNIELL